jgi:two-component system KDP operon response regulator KdpE
VTASRQPRILVVDDEPPITRVLSLILKDRGYQVEVAHEGQTALACFTTWRPELVITDLYMPHVNGLEVCRRIRAQSTVPIVVLSVKDQEGTKVAALNAGADDYITKPFEIEELLARIRARLRRPGDWDPAPFVVGDFRLDIQTRRVYVRGAEVRLTPKEFELFVCFAQRPNAVLSHRVLLGSVWGAEGLDQPESLRVLIGQLRKKLEPEPSNPRYFLTEPWVGYRFNPHG